MLTQLTKSGAKLLDHKYSGEIAAGTVGLLGLAQATLSDSPGVNFAGGIMVGAAGMWGAKRVWDAWNRDRHRVPELYEYALDNYWFQSAGLADEPINPPLKGKHSVDIVIIGGGYTGLSCALHLKERFAHKEIILLEGARYGYGASGRNGGFCNPGFPSLLESIDKIGPRAARQAFDLTMYGMERIKSMAATHGLECDLEESGLLEVAFNDTQVKSLYKLLRSYESMGLEASILEGAALQDEVKSPRFRAALKLPYGGILDPAKLARGMKRAAEQIGVKIYEGSVVLRADTGKVHRIVTEQGEVRAPDMVLGLNGYAEKLGFFKNRIIPMGDYIIATEPLTAQQWESIGWRNRQGISDLRSLFNYFRPTKDGRIVFGGGDVVYYTGDGLSSGNHKTAIANLRKDLFTTFPQLEGIKIGHAWGGTLGMSADVTPSIGKMGDHGNIYYGVAYNGEGVVMAQTAGRIIADLMAGEKTEFTDFMLTNGEIGYAGPQAFRSLPIRAYLWYLRNFQQSRY
jgi:glycine/D-amino acid oxidase-like deaminating enzyme